MSWSDEQFIRRREVARELQELVRAIGVPCKHLWWPCGRLDFVPTDEHAVRHVLEAASGALRRLGREAEELIGRLGRDRTFGEQKPADVERMIRTARTALDAPALGDADHRSPGWVAEAARIEEVAEAARCFAELRSRHDAVLIAEAWNENVLAERQALRAYGDKRWRFLSGPFRAARRKLAGLCRGAMPGAVREQLELVDAILEAGRLRREVEEAGDLIGRLCPGLSLGDRAEKHRALAEAAAWLVQLHRDEEAGLVGDEIHDLLESDHDPAELRAAADACERAMEALAEALDALADVMELRRHARTRPAGSPPSSSTPVTPPGWTRPSANRRRWPGSTGRPTGASSTASASWTWRSSTATGRSSPSATGSSFRATTAVASWASSNGSSRRSPATWPSAGACGRRAGQSRASSRSSW